MKKVICVVGPTSVGKTDIGIQLAKQFNGEIISGDSIQIYKELNIGSAKVSKEEMQGVTHHLIDCLAVDEPYSVYAFQKSGREIINTLVEADTLPIIVGGTGLYIKSLLYDYQFSDETISVDQSVFEGQSDEQLYEQLCLVDPQSAKKIHPHNRKRVMRALTIFHTQQVSKSSLEQKQQHEMLYDAYIIGLTCQRDVLYERINQRVDIMMNKGLLLELEGLVARYPNIFTYQSMQGIGYKEFKGYFTNEMSLDEVVEEIKTHSRQFAKRQYTWFRNQMPVNWYDIFDETFKEKLQKDIALWKEK